MSNAVVTIDSREFERALKTYEAATTGGVEETLKRAAAGFVRRVISVTPPAMGRMSGAKKIGENAISADLGAVFAPVRLKGKRPEKTPNVPQAFRAQRGPGARKRKPAHKLAVDRRKYQRLRNAKKAKVGLLASGWVAAAEALGVSLPAWIRRHGSAAGHYVLRKFGRNGAAIVITHRGKGNTKVEGFERRVKWALTAQAGALNREAKYLLTKARRKAGL